MTQQQTLILAAALALLAFVLSDAQGVSKFQRFACVLIGVYWVSVWVHGSIWTLQ